MPSWSNAYSSARSSCFVFDTSRNAARISAELTIQDPSCYASPTRANSTFAAAAVRCRLHVKRQPSFLDVSQRYAAFVPRLGFEHRDFRPCITFDTDNSSLEPASVCRGQYIRPPSNEAPPFLGGPQRPFAR